MANKLETDLETVLDAMGVAFKDVFKYALPVAQGAEPIIAMVAPGLSSLYNLTVTLVRNAEAAAVAAGAPSGSGSQKLALVLAALQPYVAQESASLGIAPPTVAQTTAWINAIVAALNSFGVVSASAPASSSVQIGASTVTTEISK